MIEGSSATDFVTDVTDVRKKEEGRRKKEEEEILVSRFYLETHFSLACLVIFKRR
ncbi:hypothetical protein NDI47_23635 [Microcoleus vaginatus GB1-A2]|uniref:hypothetical protein n=1 Tax=Microcoleus vaginatus TaxID=119532 RepID=UPI0016840BDC|nr:hypothetical protein [Microcoleus sp. FACHB-61]